MRWKRAVPKLKPEPEPEPEPEPPIAELKRCLARARELLLTLDVIEGLRVGHAERHAISEDVNAICLRFHLVHMKARGEGMEEGE